MTTPSWERWRREIIVVQHQVHNINCANPGQGAHAGLISLSATINTWAAAGGCTLEPAEISAAVATRLGLNERSAGRFVVQHRHLTHVSPSSGEVAWMASASEAAAPEGAAVGSSAPRPAAQPNHQCLAANNNGWVCRSQRAHLHVCQRTFVRLIEMHTPILTPAPLSRPFLHDAKQVFTRTNLTFLATTHPQI